MNSVLIVEDEYNFARFVELELRHEGYNVQVAFDGQEGLCMALEKEWHMILLDVMLPGMDGFEVCRRIRERKNTPIIMLTARDSVADRVSGLDTGADDYIPKPFAIEELLARMRAVDRRRSLLAGNGDVLAFRDLRLDPAARTVFRNGETITLTKREFDLLAVFMSNIKRILTREALIESVWGVGADVETNVVDVYVRYVRNKIGDSGEDGYIHTIRGIGYVMR
ncbi:response regulator [Cohnella sp. CFH 77786]|uniref:response regulator transcription factor n=1 Tax=Cohnella sp. CFH 77786 TaxID=2662265 RepID=UPI001C60FDEC|nr:response regulator transcription factor [Cohnella sp. CFH 77786]MBW5446011.1 response regulator [Cohnella sp. CFH 77786]